MNTFNNRHLHPQICICVFVFALQQLKEAHTLRYIFMENSGLCYEVTEKVVQHIVHCVETQGRHVEYLKALKTLVKAEGQSIRKTQDMVMAEVTSHFSASSNRLASCAFRFLDNAVSSVTLCMRQYCIMIHNDCLVSFLFFDQLVNVGEEVLVFYSDPQSFNSLVDMMQSERERLDQSGPLLYHINLVELLACCTEGKNVYTEIKCHSLLPLDDIVRVVTHPDAIPEVSESMVR